MVEALHFYALFYHMASHLFIYLITPCHKNRMTTRAVTFLTSFTTTVSEMSFLTVHNPILKGLMKI